MDWEKPLDDSCFEEFNLTCYGLGKAYFTHLKFDTETVQEMTD